MAEQRSYSFLSILRASHSVKKCIGRQFMLKWWIEGVRTIAHSFIRFGV